MWTQTRSKKYGVAVYKWNSDVKYGLPLEIGETVHILEECGGWFRGCSTRNRSLRGIFPAAYIHLKPFKIDNDGLYETITPMEDPVVLEVTLVLREWGGIWKRLFVEREQYKFDTLGKVMRELQSWRRQLIVGTLTQDQTRELKLKITAKIDWGNRKLGLDLVPRIGSEMVDASSTSVVEVHQVHVQSAENSQGASARGTVKRKEVKRSSTHHLFFCMRHFGYHVGEDVEVYFSLYNAKKAKYISERFLIKISKDGFSNYVEKLHHNCTTFTDLGNADLNKDLYLVAHVMRIGRMLFSDSSKKSGSQVFKRPHGCAVLNVNEILMCKEMGAEEREFTFKVYQSEEKDFYQMHELIIKKQSNKYSLVSGQPNYGIVVSLKMLHGELSQVRQENPLLFKNISLTKKIGFSDVIMPGDVRNDMYLTIDRGEFEKGGRSTGKNIEVNVLLLDSEGNILENCIWGATGQEGCSEYLSMILYHHNSPHWTETIRLAVPIEKFYGSHLRLEFRHCSRDKNEKRLFGFAFAKLMDEEGTTLHNGQHDLFVYKCEDKTKLQDPSLYLSLPFCLVEGNEAIIGNQHFQRSVKEFLYVETMLCSTKLTQNVDLLSLLKWKTQPDKIQDTLNRLIKLNGEEIVKFLQDMLDALFSMFSTEDGNSTSHSGLVFHVLVNVFSLLEDSKFEHFKSVIDAYITGHFAAALVYKGLLSSVKHCADLVPATDKQEAIQKCFRSLEYIFKFIIQSRLLFARATGGQYEDSFRRDLFDLFTSFNKMLSSTCDVVLPTQVALLHSISAVYEQLLHVLPMVDIAKLVAAMLESLPKEPPLQLTQAKLTAIKHMVTSKLFDDHESRNLLLSTLCKHLRTHLAQRQELRLCTEILGEILKFLYRHSRPQSQIKVNNCIHQDIEVVCVATLDVLVQTVLIIERSAAVVGNLVACFFGLLQLLDEFHYKRLWDEFAERKEMKHFLLDVFSVFHDLVKQEAFPADWVAMQMTTNSVALSAFQELAQPLILYFLEGPHFDNELWSNYFNLAVAFLTQPALQLETFSDVKREKIVKKYGDMRVRMGFQILSMWSNLGERKVDFIPSMVGPFLEVTLVPEPDLRKATLHIFFDMMECEQRCRGNFKQVECELIDKLDILVSENKGDDEYRQLFNTILLERVRSNDPAWKDSGAAFINSVTRLLERLLDYRNVIQGDENRDKRMSCTVNLLNFYKNEINRKEMYLRYIYKLHDLHLPAENYTEAAFTLKLHADQLTWSKKTLHADLTYPAQQEWQRKEQLYLKIIEYFDKGKFWEKGIPLCKELAELYEKKLFDYAKLSHILTTQAKFYDNILTQLRPEPEYFRVGFYGQSFPLFVRNKLFVYRGLEYERIEAFTQRLQMEFPSAQILMKNTPPDDSIVKSDGQYIQICNVKPIPEENPMFDDALDVPAKIKNFYQVNDVKIFVFDRPVHKGPVDKDNEFKSLWIERTTLVIGIPLPGILRWFEVTERSLELVPPVQFACETVESVSRELKQLISQYSADPHRSINPLSMRLQGTIDANVMGGISKYQEAFFKPEFVKNHPEYNDHIHRLRTLIVDQVEILEAGLSIHGRLAPPGVQPLHKRLVECCNQLKQAIKESGSPSLLRPASSCTLRRSDSDTGSEYRKPGSIINTPLPPVPTEKKLIPADPPSNRSSTSSSSMYGHLVPDDTASDDEAIYSKPVETTNETPATPPRSLVNPPPPIPSREARPKSIAYSTGSVDSGISCRPSSRSGDYILIPAGRNREVVEGDLPLPRPPKPLCRSKPTSPKLLSKYSHSSTCDSLRNSWSEASGDEAPPLPPRGCTPDKRANHLTLDIDQIPPAPPKRLVKKSSSPAIISMDLVSMEVSVELPNSSRPDSPDSDAISFLVRPPSTSPPPPPPLPPKSVTPLASPMVPPNNLNHHLESPPESMENNRSPSPEDRSPTLRKRIHRENYAIPKLQSSVI